MDIKSVGYLTGGFPLFNQPLRQLKLFTTIAKNFNEVLLFLFLMGTSQFTVVCLWSLSATISAHAALADKTIALFGAFFFSLATANLSYVFSLKE